MAVFVKIGDHWINPLNVAYLQMVTVEQEIKETTAGKTDVRKEQVTAVEIVTLVGDHECNRIRLDGGADIVAVAKELSLGMNTVPID